MKRVRRGLTLVEVLIAIALIAMLMGVLFVFFWQTGQVRAEVSDRVNRTQLARQVLSRIADELRGCVGFDDLRVASEPRLIGDRRQILFLTTTLPDAGAYRFFGEFDQLPPAAYDLKLVGYQLWIDPDERDDNGDPIVGGIIRTEKRTLNQHLVNEDDPQQLRQDVWAPEMGYLEFRYFDGVEWDTKWDLDQGNSLPQIIMVTVGFTNITREEADDGDLSRYPIEEFPFGPEEVHEDRYSMVIRLPGADKLYGTRFQRMGKQMSEQLGLEGLR